MFYTYDEFVSTEGYVLPEAVQDVINKINQKFTTSTTLTKPTVQKTAMWTGGRIRAPIAVPKQIVPEINEESDKIKINTQLIRISLNKLSLKNYVVQKEVIVTSLTFFVNREKATEIVEKGCNELDSIVDLMYTIITTNMFFNEVYCKLYNELQQVFPFLEKKLSTSFVSFFSTLTRNIVDSSMMTFDELCVYNASKAERKAMAVFYAQMKNLGKIQMTDIITLLENIQQFIITCDIMDIKDELVDIICIIFSKCNSASKHNTDWVLYVKQLGLFTECPVISKKSTIMILNAIE
jgi:hypothetical protein